jgi:hypothetical protein
MTLHRLPYPSAQVNELYKELADPIDIKKAWI